MFWRCVKNDVFLKIDLAERPGEFRIKLKKPEKKKALEEGERGYGTLLEVSSLKPDESRTNKEY